jgi:integrase/recombinase XerD
MPISRVLAIPVKRAERAIVAFLTAEEAGALLAAPDLSRRAGRRDHALLALAVQTGLRVPEITGLRVADGHRRGPQAHPAARRHGCSPLPLSIEQEDQPAYAKAHLRDEDDGKRH